MEVQTGLGKGKVVLIISEEDRTGTSGVFKFLLMVSFLFCFVFISVEPCFYLYLQNI